MTKKEYDNIVQECKNELKNFGVSYKDISTLSTEELIKKLSKTDKSTLLYVGGIIGALAVLKEIKNDLIKE